MRDVPFVALVALLLVVAGVAPAAAMAADTGAPEHDPVLAGQAAGAHLVDASASGGVSAVAGESVSASTSLADAPFTDALLHGSAGTAHVDGAGIDALGELAFDDLRERGEHALDLARSGGAEGLPSVPLLVGGYSRYDDSDPLENDHRAAVFEVVGDAPGIAVSEVAKRADVSRSTARYHTRVLEAEGLVFGEKIRGKLRYFPADDEMPELTAALADEAAAGVLFAVARRGPVSVSALAEALDRAPSTVSHHLSRLDEAGLVERERDGGAVLTRVTPEVDAALAERPTLEGGPAVGAHADD
ncbi:winged helix-turn-helix transcriptional regulator [Halobium salinum]|uniref:Winged helix-turn-helix transcriptional regulator n=1 Tax=Halobium salinum TaxID=1364940 RepID=A0ABD5P6L8_9EURY|nr:helix-turn-helix domain-containing protein [Halobium salinum]